MAGRGEFIEDDLLGIINYAISKEQEAMDFYNNLATQVKNKAIAEELKKIAKMEEGHREKLKKIDVESFAGSTPSKVTNLKIADYLVKKEPSPDMSWQDLLQIAMQRELASMKLYTDLSNLAINHTIKQLFQNLAREEEGHKHYFETIYDDEILREN